MEKWTLKDTKARRKGCIWDGTMLIAFYNEQAPQGSYVFALQRDHNAHSEGRGQFNAKSKESCSTERCFTVLAPTPAVLHCEFFACYPRHVESHLIGTRLAC